MDFSYIPVIVTFNRREKLIMAIKSILKQTVQPQKIIIVDNHSTDGTESFVRKEYSKLIDEDIIEYHYLSENVGGSGGFSRGVKWASQYNAKYIAVSDDDAFYESDYFKEISEAAKLNPNVKAFQGVAYDSKQQKYFVQGRKIKNWNTLDSEEIPYKNKNVYADTVTFVGFVFAKDLVNEVGAPVDDFFIWNDDAEYSLRIGKLTKILQVNKAIVDHMGTQRSSEKLTPIWKTYYGFRNKLIIRKKYSKNYLVAMLISTFELIRHWIAILIKPQYQKQRFAYIQAFTIAYNDAINDHLGKNPKYLPGTKY